MEDMMENRLICIEEEGIKSTTAHEKNIWESGKTITISSICRNKYTSDEYKASIIEQISKWEECCGVKFSIANDYDFCAGVTVTFDPLSESYSYKGAERKSACKSLPNMNHARIDKEDNDMWTLHLFGYAIGLNAIFEIPEQGIDYLRDKYKDSGDYFERMILPYFANESSDKKSIMYCRFNGTSYSPINSSISSLDKELVRKIYGPPIFVDRSERIRFMEAKLRTIIAEIETLKKDIEKDDKTIVKH